MADDWAAFRVQAPAPINDPWSAFRQQPQATAQTAPAPDKYQQAALDERKAIFPNEDAGGSYLNGAASDAGFTRRLAHGFTLGADTTALAALETIPEMIKRGVNPKEAYNYAKAREDLIMSKSRENTGLLGTGAEALGAAASAGGLAKAGVTAARYLPEGASLLQKAGAGALDAAGIGGFSGAMEGNGLQERGENAVKGAGVGAVAGFLAPPVVALAKVLATPITSQILARANPKEFAQAQVARAISESGLTPDEVSLAMVHAHNEGQGVFTLADALGNPGQRMLSTVARSPGEGRTAVVDAMNSRQGDQGRRLSGALREGFEAPQTADQTQKAMQTKASAEATTNYAPVKSEMQPIDVSEPVAIANRAISPAADMDATARGLPPTDLAARAATEGQESVISDPIKSALKQARSYLAAPELTSSNVNMAFRAKTNIDQMISSATEKGQGALVGELIPIKNALDHALARTSGPYASARDAYKIAQQRIEALSLGKNLGSKSIRPEDAISQFNPLDAESKAAFRVGYADPQISQVQNSAFGTNKARPFTSDATKQEFNAFTAPGKADLLQRQIGRENTMFETRQQALGGSRTAENLNDDAAMAVSPEVVSVLKDVATGNVGGAIKTAIAAGKNGLTGNTAAVRKAVADILLQTGQKIPASAMQDMVDKVLKKAIYVAKIADGATRGAVGGVAVTGPGQNRR